MYLKLQVCNTLFLMRFEKDFKMNLNITSALKSLTLQLRIGNENN